MVDHKDFRGTTILMVRRGDKVAVAGDGQVTFGDIFGAAIRQIRPGIAPRYRKELIEFA